MSRGDPQARCSRGECCAAWILENTEAKSRKDYDCMVKNISLDCLIWDQPAKYQARQGIDGNSKNEHHDDAAEGGQQDRYFRIYSLV